METLVLAEVYTVFGYSQSKLGNVLPILPEEYKFIAVTMQGANESTMNSLKFEKKKISEVLTLLKRTDCLAWHDINISQDHLDRWDDKVGNLAKLNNDSQVVKVDHIRGSRQETPHFQVD